MCGIVGYIGTAPPDEGRVSACLGLMKQRGPDSQGTFSCTAGAGGITLLHSRLSIIDLDPRSDQPFTIGPATVVFNGEIYNYREIRADLKREGIQFRTESDTEVLLQSYLRYGVQCLERFEGMWSFIIYDSRDGSLLLSRDRFGEKPLYYLKTADGYYFASEIKFIKALSSEELSINHKHLLRYLVNGYKSLYKTNETYFEGVFEFPAASYAVVHDGSILTPACYWRPRVVPVSYSLQEAIEETRIHLMESIRIRLRADVPLAFCLSGGVDSSALLSIAVKEFGCKASAFSLIDQDERYNEYDNVMATVDDLGCDHTLIKVGRSGTIERLRGLVAYHDGPVATISYYIHSFISEAVSRAGYRVSFSGTAADELFTGYYDHFNLHLYEMRNHSDYQQRLAEWREHIAPIVRNPFLKNPEVYLKNPEERRHIYLGSDEFAAYLRTSFDEPFREGNYCESLLRNRMLNELLHECTPMILHEDDLNSMMYSVENRSPYLDSRLCDFACSLPPEHLIRHGYGKYLLREAMQGILNDTVRLDRQKKGFNASINSVIDFVNTDTKDYLLADGPVFDLIDRNKIESAMTMNPAPNSYSKFLFNFINIKMFMEQQS